MGFFDNLFDRKESKDTRFLQDRGFVDYGRNKPDGGHDHRTNKGKDRTPAQKKGDRARTKKD